LEHPSLEISAKTPMGLVLNHLGPAKGQTSRRERRGTAIPDALLTYGGGSQHLR
jgi:hypothetical protein